MLDDGNNNDGLPNDGIFGAKISNTCNKIDFYVYAENNIVGEFSLQEQLLSITQLM